MSEKDFNSKVDCIEKEMKKIEKGFEKLLMKNDSDSMSKIYFSVCYQGNYYKINIFPRVDTFNSRQYFIDYFEKKKVQKKLAKFANKNNIGIVSY